MPQPFNNAVITNSGARLLTRAQAGEIKIEITRIAVGNGDYTEDEKSLSALQKQTNLKAPKNSYAISNLEVYSDYSVKVTALITNLDPVTGTNLVNTGYFINEMGLFAKEKDGESDTEVLYSIAVTSGDNGDFMPPYNGYNPAQIIQDYFATVNNSSEVYIKTTGAAALAEDVISIRQDVEQLKRNGAADGYSADVEYNVGDYCIHKGILYRCLQDATGEWNPEYWQKTNPMGEIMSLRSAMSTQMSMIESLTKILSTDKDGNLDMLMHGATEEAAGIAGMVPAPAAGMQDAVLHGNGMWGNLNLGSAAYAAIANNAATTEEGFVPDARIITAQQKQIDELNSALESIDINSRFLVKTQIKAVKFVTAGIYCMLITCNGASGGRYAAYLVNGYGIGAARTHVTELHTGKHATELNTGDEFRLIVLEDELGIKIVNSNSQWDCSVLALYGKLPTVINI